VVKTLTLALSHLMGEGIFPGAEQAIFLGMADAFFQTMLRSAVTTTGGGRF
jgi:hypothetical protein